MNERNYLRAMLAKHNAAKSWGRIVNLYIFLALVLFLPLFILVAKYQVMNAFLFCILYSALNLLLLCILANQRDRLAKSTKEVLTDLVSTVLRERMELSTYNPNSYIEKKNLAAMHILPSYDKLKGSDYIKGRYRGRNLEYCELALTREETDSDGDSSTVTVFKGGVLRIYTGKILDGRVCLHEKENTQHKTLFGKMLGAIIPDNSLKTENEQFSEQFGVYTTNQHTAFYILTPQFMERLVKIDQFVHAKTSFSFADGYVNILMHGSRNLFEAESYAHVSTDAELTSAIRYDAQLIYDILDILMENETLWN